MSTHYILGSIFVMAFITMLTRGLPYLLFRHKEISPSLQIFGRRLPAAIMPILVIYCLRNITLGSYPYGLREILPLLLLVLLQKWKKNDLLSIFSATFFYMLLLRI
ncbi:MAG: AzlD domain-containing protein [Tissierellia bacterium]|nr:AzlD domain-containing protein [Tissierellia bacterium]